MAAASYHDLNKLQKLDAVFFEVADFLGVKLAPRDDKDKSFGPSQDGVVLGIYYDTKNWVWALPEEKLARLMVTLDKTIKASSISQQDMWSLTGKLIHIKPLIPSGKYNIDHVLRANSLSDDKDFVVKITDELRSQLEFWRTVIPLCNGFISIPDPDPFMPPWTIEVYTDAAGGTVSSAGHGVGAVAGTWWCYAPWGWRINTGQDAGNDRALDRVLSALELLGPLITVSAGARWCQNAWVRVHVDNAASVFIWKKGYSTSCKLSSSLLR